MPRAAAQRGAPGEGEARVLPGDLAWRKGKARTREVAGDWLPGREASFAFTVPAAPPRSVNSGAWQDLAPARPGASGAFLGNCGRSGVALYRRGKRFPEGWTPCHSGDGLGESGLGVAQTPGAHMLLLQNLLSLSVLSPLTVGLAGSAWAVGAAHQVSKGRRERILLRSLRSTCISYETTTYCCSWHLMGALWPPWLFSLSHLS